MFPLLRRGDSMVGYTLRAWAWTTPLTLVVAVAGTLAMQVVGLPSFEQNQEINRQIMQGGIRTTYLYVVVFSPLSETLLMGPILWALGWLTRPLIVRALASAAVWGGLHSLAVPIWGLFVLWPFFVFSVAFLVWQRTSWWRAFAVVAALHALHNATVLSMALL